MLLLGFFACTLKERLIFFIFKILTDKLFENFVSRLSVLGERRKNLIHKRNGDIINISVNALNLCIFLGRIYAKRNV